VFLLHDYFCHPPLPLLPRQIYPTLHHRFYQILLSILPYFRRMTMKKIISISDDTNRVNKQIFICLTSFKLILVDGIIHMLGDCIQIKNDIVIQAKKMLKKFIFSQGSMAQKCWPFFSFPFLHISLVDQFAFVAH
jgi:hypothetical protein